jgi:hypothetical protein
MDRQLNLLIERKPPSGYGYPERAYDSTENGWRDVVWRELKAAAASGLSFRCDDLRCKVGEPDHPNRWGAIWPPLPASASTWARVDARGPVVPTLT